jgi:hypothetical protein
VPETITIRCHGGSRLLILHEPPPFPQNAQNVPIELCQGCPFFNPDNRATITNIPLVENFGTRYILSCPSSDQEIIQDLFPVKYIPEPVVLPRGSALIT